MTDDHRDTWDLLVVGGGTAGIVGAKTAAGFGARVLLVERDRTGGDCLWTGCVPSKALLAAAARVADLRRADRFGIDTGPVRVHFDRVIDHVRAATARIEPVDSPAALRAAGVTVLSGTARFTDPETAVVDGQDVRFRQALLATGASPTLPPIAGLGDAGPLTSDTVWELTELPERLLVLGGGTIGCELGQAFARLGAEVTVVEGAERVLPAEDTEASATVAASLRADGVELVLGCDVASVAADRAGGPGKVRLTDGRRLGYDRLLVAVGRTPTTADLGLAQAGVEVDQHGQVVVDGHLRTSNARIWAAGDLTGHARFTHVAGVHGSLAASNAVLGLRRSVDTTVVPRVTFTDPEVAAVGVPTSAVERDPGLSVVAWHNEHVDRAVTEQRTEGVVKLVVDRRRRILGAVVVGPRAGEVLAELTLAIQHGMRTRDLAGVVHPYPTYGDGVWNAAVGDLRESLARPAVARLTRGLTGARRLWLEHGPSGATRTEGEG